MNDEEFWEFQRKLRAARTAKAPVYLARFSHLKYAYFGFMKPYANFVPSTDDPKHADFLFYLWYKAGENWQESKYVVMDGYPVREALEKTGTGTWLGHHTDKNGVTHLLTLTVEDGGHLENDGKNIHGAEVTLSVDGNAVYRTADFYWHGNPNGANTSPSSPDLGDWSGVTVCHADDVPEDAKGYDRYVLWHFAVVKEDIGE